MSVNKNQSYFLKFCYPLFYQDFPLMLYLNKKINVSDRHNITRMNMVIKS